MSDDHLEITGQRWSGGMLVAVEINGDANGKEPWFTREPTESSLSKALARVAELEGALREIDEYKPSPSNKWIDDWDIYQDIAATCKRMARTALHREPGDAKPVSAADMRERAAQKVKKMRVTILPQEFAESVEQARGQFVAAIRALPLTALQGSDNG